LVVAAAFADRSGSAAVSFYAFLGLVVVAAVLALSSYGALVETAPGVSGSERQTVSDETWRKLQALLWAVLLALAVVGAAARAPAVGAGAIPGISGTVVISCLLVLCVEGLVELDSHRRSVPVRRVLVPDRARQRRREAA
jgi:hypothetical protein